MPIRDHPSSLTIDFSFFQESSPVQLKLDRDDGIYSQDVTVNHVRADGSTDVQQVPAGTHLAYHGTVQSGGKLGWVRVSAYLEDSIPLIEGAMAVGDSVYTIQTDFHYRVSRQPGDPDAEDKGYPYLVAHTDAEVHQNLSPRQDQGSTCGVTPDDDLSARSPLLARQNGGQGVNPLDTIGSTEGCPSSRLIALLGVATDCTYITQFRSPDDMRQNIITQVNSASRVYEDTFNISLRVRNITIMERDCNLPNMPAWNVACSSSVSMSTRLRLFAQWKRNFRDDTAVWTLLSNCPDSSAVGIAYLGTTCHPGTDRRGNSGISGVNVVTRNNAEWQILAHEIGHNFGASHDCTTGCSISNEDCCPASSSSCTTPGQQFMMNPAVGRHITAFSPCSIGSICANIGRSQIQTACMQGNENVTTISTQQCGNGIVDPGEDCDCGSAEECGNNQCCDPSTCRFRAGALCDPSSQSCCTDQCQMSSSGTVCRASTGLCDPEETCDGSSASCPRDRQLDDGATCGVSASNTTCASGRCTSRTMQCAAALGVSNSSVQACDDSTCQLSCLSLDGGNNQCRRTQQSFLDGTPCGGGARCYSGSCSRVGSDARSWIDRNRTLFIIICVVGGILVIGVLLACVCCCRRSKRAAPVSRGAPMMSAANMQQQPPPAFIRQNSTPLPRYS